MTLTDDKKRRQFMTAVAASFGVGFVVFIIWMVVLTR